MVIEDKDILQANATVVAGILIFLTIMHLKPSKLETRKEKLTAIAQTFALLVALVPFSLSSYLLLVTDDFLHAKILSAIGFLWMVSAVLIFAIVSRLPIKEKTMQHE